MPTPDATPAPTPAFGLFGAPLQPAGNGELKEKAPNGDTVFWHLEVINGEQRWIMYKTVQAEKGVQA